MLINNLVGKGEHIIKRIYTAGLYSSVYSFNVFKYIFKLSLQDIDIQNYYNISTSILNLFMNY